MRGPIPSSVAIVYSLLLEVRDHRGNLTDAFQRGPAQLFDLAHGCDHFTRVAGIPHLEEAGQIVRKPEIPVHEPAALAPVVVQGSKGTVRCIGVFL